MWDIVLHGTHFRGDEPDHEWIPKAAANGWLILTCDKRIRKWSTEGGLARRAAIESCAKIFYMSRGSRPLHEYAEGLLKARDRILKLARKHRGGTLYAKVMVADGSVEPMFMDKMTVRDKTRQRYGRVG